MTNILYELTASLPVKIEITEGKGRRFAFKLTDQFNVERVYNLHHPEQLYMHVDDSVLAVIVAREQQEPGAIKSWLKNLIRNRPLDTTATIEPSGEETPVFRMKDIRSINIEKNNH